MKFFSYLGCMKKFVFYSNVHNLIKDIQASATVNPTAITEAERISGFMTSFS